MQYYYDINLCFNDYYINYYEWDDHEHFNRLPIFRVLNARVFLEYNIKVDVEYKNIIISDGITSLALEIIDKKLVYVSSLPYEDEFKINKLVIDTPETLKYEVVEKKNTKVLSNIEKAKQRLLLLIKNNDKDFVKYVYYEITGKLSNDYDEMVSFLTNDIKSNFSNQYYKIYDMIMIGD